MGKTEPTQKISFKPVAPDESGRQRPLGKRLLWLLIFMMGGLTLVGSVAYALRGLLFIAQ